MKRTFHSDHTWKMTDGVLTGNVVRMSSSMLNLLSPLFLLCIVMTLTLVEIAETTLTHGEIVAKTSTPDEKIEMMMIVSPTSLS
jgi:hypothetical protein